MTAYIFTGAKRDPDQITSYNYGRRNSARFPCYRSVGSDGRIQRFVRAVGDSGTLTLS
jgi:hypothetical protein